MEARLADYRAKKKQAQLAAERRQFWRDVITLKFIRNRIPGVRFQIQPRAAWVTHHNPNQEGPESEPEVDAAKPWTPIDYAIVLVKFLIWLCTLAVCIKIEIASLYVVLTGFALIFFNLGDETSTRRGQARVSAYSVFNKDCQSIDGTLTGEQFDAEIRHKLK